MRRRGWKRPFAGVAVVVLGGIVAAWAAAQEGERVPMLVTATDVAAGDVLGDTDVRVVHALGVEDLELVPADNVIGATAAVPVPAGTVLTEPMLADASDWPGPGQAVMSVDAPPGMFPASAREGAPLLIVGGQDVEEDDGGEPIPARLHSVGDEGELSGSQVIELLVDVGDVAEAARVVGEPGTRLVLTPGQ
ncbi:SAF domain-containing protein [Nocardiopsis sp. NPDC049922]|uniref:SAF domain-containing protein n=1 Tax=Nocardiopsis sp. NPDC049922 TaxID=3155157 RepID=UPI0033CC20BE